jgi:glycosyltransferase involved in cell wall biosynthesis
MTATVDIQAVQSVDHPERGIARTVTDLVGALEACHAESIAAYAYHPRLPLPRWLAPLARDQRLVAAPDLRRRTAPVHLVASPFEGSSFDEMLPPPTRLGSASLATVLYDLIPLRYPEHYLADPITRRRYSARCELVRGADAVLAISEQTARDATDLLGIAPRRVHVVGCAPSGDFRPPDDRATARRDIEARFPDLAARFVLCPGGADWRKNLRGLVDGWAATRDAVDDGTVELVITGQLRAHHDEIVDHARRAGVDGSLRLAGRVSEEDLRLLYQTAHLVVFPSWFEGYGLPVMEARRSGTAVVASRNSSLVELLPDHALFDLDDPGDLARHLTRALEDPTWTATLREVPDPPGHTWAEVADRTAAVLDGLTRRPRGRRRRLQLAVVAPLPPQPSGVADHSMRLLAALAPHADVHAFTDDLSLVRPPDGVGLHRLAHLGRAGATRGQFDAVVHCWGNSEIHAPMLPALREWPGIVLAHDVAVAGLYDWCSRHRPDLVDDASFAQLLHRAYGDRLPLALWGADDLSYLDADACGLTMAGEAIDRAERYLTHSLAAASLARDERPSLGDRVDVVPFAFPPPRAPRSPERVGDPPVVATFGIVSLTKCVDLVVDAFAVLAARHPTAILAFVGHVGHGLRTDLQRRAETHGFADRLVCTGRVPPETYEQWLSITDVAVQLRRSWGGEASAATADTMAWGVPTVVSDIGWARELPSDAVSAVAGDASPDQVARAVADLLDDRQLRAQRAHASIAHASAHGFERLADQLLALVRA